MSAPKNLSEVRERDGRDLMNYCRHNPNVKSIRECGDHVMVKGPKGTAVFCDREMGTGLWHKVIRMMTAVGLVLFIFLVLTFIL
jgi:hypothetical protein